MPRHLSLPELIAAHPEWQRPETLPFTLTPQMISVFTRRNVQTVLLAMRSGHLRATQTVRGGCWHTTIEHVVRWMEGEPPLARTPLRPAVRRSA